jgi:uncharacterized protein (DUF1778 family)
MATRSGQLQIRVTPREKAAIKRLARAAGLDVSAYVLRRVLPPVVERLDAITRRLLTAEERRFALAELHDLLASLAADEFAVALERVDVRGLDAITANYVAAMAEQAAHVKGISAPEWTRDIEPLEEPYFATPLKGVRTYLIGVAPAAFKRRNIFADAVVGTRV